MKLWIRSLIVLIIVAGLASSITAAPICQIDKMLDSAQSTSWDYPICYIQLADYIERLGEPAKHNVCRKPALISALANIIQNTVPPLHLANDERYKNWMAVRSLVLNKCDMVDENYYLFWDKTSGTYKQKRYNYENQLKKKIGQQVIIDHIRNVLPNWSQLQAWEEINQANRHTGKLQGVLDNMLAEAQTGQDLHPFVDLIVNEGSSDKKDPRYVSDNLLNIVFYLYAYSLRPTDADKLIAYTASKYDGRVRFAAASAAAEFSENYQDGNGRKFANANPPGHLTFTDAQRRQIAEILATTDKTLDKQENHVTHWILISKLARLYQNPWAAVEQYAQVNPASDESGSSLTSLLTSGSLAMVVPKRIAATLVTQNGNVEIMMASLLVYGFYNAFEDASRNAMQQARFEKRMLESLATRPDVTQALKQESIGVVTLEEENNAHSGVLPYATTGTRAEESRGKRNVCVYLGASADIIPDVRRTDASSDILSNNALKNPKFILLGDRTTYDYWNSPVPEFPGATRGECIRKKLTIECIAEREELQRLYNKRNSFVGSSTLASGSSVPNRHLHVRAVWRQGAFGGWVLNVENADGHEVVEGSRPQNIDRSIDEVLNGMFDEKTAKLIGRTLHEAPGHFNTINLQGYRHMKFRDGAHDKDNPTVDHFHLEQKCMYNPHGERQVCEFGKAPTAGSEYYICNLAIYHNPVEQYTFRPDLGL